MQSKKPFQVLMLVSPEHNREVRFGALCTTLRIAQVSAASEPALRELFREEWNLVVCHSSLASPGMPSIADLAGSGEDAPMVLFFDFPAAMSPAADTAPCSRAIRHRLRELFYFDPLTGLPNGAFLAEVFHRATAPPLFEKLVLMLVNLRRFSLVRQCVGREDGNKVLVRTANRLRAAVGNDGIVARIGGDRYAVLLLQHEAGAECLELAARISECLSPPFEVADDDLFFSHQVGISIYPDNGLDFDTLEASAELAMKAANRQGRDNCSFYSARLDKSVERRVAVERLMCRALRGNGFMLHYQPQYDVNAGRITGMEALLRLHPSLGAPASPADFVPVLEDSGLIVLVGEWVLRSACLRNLQWQQAGYPPVRIAVNLSVVQIEEADIVDTVDRVLQETGLDARYLELEITESMAMLDERTIAATLRSLRDLGVTLAIDDFGKGYSSLGYLQQFPVHRLKIDRSFVHAVAGAQAGIGTERHGGAALLGSIIDLARNIGIEVLAEGVETPAQAALLRRFGCKEMQGFLFNRPADERFIPLFFEQIGHGWMDERLDETR